MEPYREYSLKVEAMNSDLKRCWESAVTNHENIDFGLVSRYLLAAPSVFGSVLGVGFGEPTEPKAVRWALETRSTKSLIAHSSIPSIAVSLDFWGLTLGSTIPE